MQPTKDSFYVTLRDRLVAVDPNRTIMLDGATRPAIVVAENEPPGTPPTLCDAFYLYWGAARPVPQSGTGTLMEMECVISYRTKGSDASGNLDRGRDLASLDNDILAICAPPNAHKCDYSTGTPCDLGSALFWMPPVFSALVNAPPYVGREASVTVFFYPEVNQT
jgi:hypothetical protein